MQITLSPTTVQKLIIVKDETRIYSLEFPAGADLAELYGVASTMKDQLWNTLEQERSKEKIPTPEVEVKEVEVKEVEVKEVE